MKKRVLFEQAADRIDHIIARDTEEAKSLRAQLLEQHAADIVDFLSIVDVDDAHAFFLSLPREEKLRIFHALSEIKKVSYLGLLNEADRRFILSNLSIDELTDFFDDLSDEELKNYLRLLHKKDRTKVLSLLQFVPDSAGGVMDTDVITLMQDFSVAKSIKVLQRLQPDRALHRRIFVTDQYHRLVGYIVLEDLVLRKPHTRLFDIMKENELVAYVHEDREDIAKQMMRYKLTIVPVVDKENTFLGVIPSDTLIEIIEEESSEDLYRMASLSPIRYTYFETPFMKLLYQRSSILMVLLLVQSFSTMILEYYEAAMAGFFTLFITKLISAGGNTSNQTSAIVVQGLATGEIKQRSAWHFIGREILMSLVMALILGGLTFFQVYLTHGDMLNSSVIGIALSLIVVISATLGSCIPFLLDRFGFDPAHSAGPLLATIMDVLGLFVYCNIVYFFIT